MSSLLTPFATMHEDLDEVHAAPPPLKRNSGDLSFLPSSEAPHLQLPDLPSECSRAPQIRPRTNAPMPEFNQILPDVILKPRRHPSPPPTIVSEHSSTSMNEPTTGLIPAFRCSTPSSLSLDDVNVSESMLSEMKPKRHDPKRSSDKILPLDSWHCPLPSMESPVKRLPPRHVARASDPPEFSTHFLPLLSFC